jgi:hypothetical protein
MLHLLDADTLITGDRRAYPLRRFPIFWDWLSYQGGEGNVKIPFEQFEEITAGHGELVEWLQTPDIKAALLFDEEASPALVADVMLRGYGNLDEDEIELVGRDPFLIAYAAANAAERTIVSFEVSAPRKQRARRKIPDVCQTLGIHCCTLFDMIHALDFTTDWRRPR